MKARRISFTHMNINHDGPLEKTEPPNVPCNPTSMMYAPYAVHADDSGVLSSSTRSTPHCAQNDTCILCSLTTARTVSAAAAKSEYSADLAARRLLGISGYQRKAFKLYPVAIVPVCSSVIFEIEIILSARRPYLCENLKAVGSETAAHLRKWMKRSRESVPSPSCLTRSCSTNCFHTSTLERISVRTSGYGSFCVGLRHSFSGNE